MSLRGEVTIECDVKDCHAEIVLPAYEFDLVLDAFGIALQHYAGLWRCKDRTFICPACTEEGKELP